MQQNAMPFGMHRHSMAPEYAFSQGVPGLQQLTQQLEEPSGTFPATRAFLQLTSNLLDAGLADSTLQVVIMM